MTRHMTVKDAGRYLSDTESEARELRPVIAEIMRRGHHSARDGYPSGSRDGGRSTETPDPTYGAATAPPMTDHVARSIDDLIRLLDEVRKRVQVMRNLRLRIFEVEESERGRQNDIPNCANLWCGGSLHDQGPTGRGIAGRCETCYEYRRVNNADRSRELVGKDRARKEKRLAEAS